MKAWQASAKFGTRTVYEPLDEAIPGSDLNLQRDLSANPASKTIVPRAMRADGKSPRS